MATAGLDETEVVIGLGRIVALETEAPNLFVNLVQSGRAVVQRSDASGPQVVIIADPTSPAANRQLIEFRGKVGRIAIEVEGKQSANPRTGAMVPFSVLKVCGSWRRTYDAFGVFGTTLPEDILAFSIQAFKKWCRYR